MSIPFTVIGGFLGAGKTTLLNRVLSQSAGIRYAVLVNDFGALNIDAGLIAAHDGETIALANGCICCSIGDSLVDSLVALMERPDIADHILVEASGVSDPARIADVAVIDPALSLDGVVVMVDAASLGAQIDDRLIGETVRRQLVAADLLVCNKMDLLSTEERTAVLARLAELAPRTPVVPAVQADLPLAAVLGQRGETARPAVPDGHRHDDHEDSFARAVIVADEPPRRAAFEASLTALPPSVLRGKGHIRFAEAPAEACLLHLVGRRWSLSAPTLSAPTLSAPTPATADQPACRLVFIGTPEMPDEAGLRACLRLPAPPRVAACSSKEYK